MTNPLIQSQTWAFNMGERSLVITHHLSNGEAISVSLIPQSIDWFTDPPQIYGNDGFLHERYRPRLMVALTLPSDRLDIYGAEVCLDSIPLKADVMQYSRRSPVGWLSITDVVLRVPFDSLDMSYQPDRELPRNTCHSMVATVLVNRPIQRRQVVSLGAELLQPAFRVADSPEMMARLEARGIKVESDPIAKLCRGCEFYHGRSYGNNFLVCGIHPYGNGENCGDFSPNEAL